MKIKKIHIEIKRLDDALSEAGEAFEKLSEGKTIRKKSAVYFSSIKDLRKVLTEKRLELLKTIKDRKPSSVYELAKISNRDIKNVLQDVGYLKEIGMIDVVDTGDKKIPKVQYDVIALELAV